MPKQRMIDSYTLMANRLRTESQAKCFNDKRDCHLWSVVTLKLGETNFFPAIHMYLWSQRNCFSRNRLTRVVETLEDQTQHSRGNKMSKQSVLTTKDIHPIFFYRIFDSKCNISRKMLHNQSCVLRIVNTKITISHVTKLDMK